MLFNTKPKRLTISILLFLLAAISLASSITGWWFSENIESPNGYTGYTYYQGFKSAGFAGIIVSSISMFFAIIFLTTEIASNNFFKKQSIVLYALIIFVILLIIPSLTLGLISYLEINDVWVLKN